MAQEQIQGGASVVFIIRKVHASPPPSHLSLLKAGWIVIIEDQAYPFPSWEFSMSTVDRLMRGTVKLADYLSMPLAFYFVL